jgi:hypothetical protein
MEFKPISKKSTEEEGDKKSNNLAAILASRNMLMENIRKHIEFSKPIISRNGVGVIYPNTINIVQGKSGVHKSRLAEYLCCSLLNPQQDYIGFKSTDSIDINLLYVDTERNISDQFPYALQRIIRGAGYNTQVGIENFDFISLIEIKRQDRFDALKEYITIARSKTTKHMVIVLDVITDCIKNFNDTSESLELVDFLNRMINKFDVTFICIIHENPGMGEKARGHLGTELHNKSTSTLQISFVKDANQKNTDLIKVTYLKCRNTRNIDPIHLQYDTIINGLMEVNDDIVRGFTDERRAKASLKEMGEVLPQFLEKRTTKTELMRLLVGHCKCSSKTIEDRLKEFCEVESLTIDFRGAKCNLKKSKTGSIVYYELVPINLTEPKLEI